MDNWKEEEKFSHYDIENQKLMTILVIMRDLEAMGVEDISVFKRLNEEVTRCQDCLKTKNDAKD